MKNILLIGGAALAGYGVYLWWQKKNGSGCGCTETTAKLVPAKEEIYPDRVLESFDTKFRSIFPTPTRLGVGALPVENADNFQGQNTVL